MAIITRLTVTTSLEIDSYITYEIGPEDWSPTEIFDTGSEFHLTLKRSRLVINKARLLSWEIRTNG